MTAGVPRLPVLGEPKKLVVDAVGQRSDRDGLRWPLLLLLFGGAMAGANAEGNPDCTPNAPHFEDDAALTKAERVQRMDEAYYTSLAQFELCHTEEALSQEAQDNQSKDSAKTPEGKASGDSEKERAATAGASPEKPQEQINSVPSSDFVGTETPASEASKQDRGEDQTDQKGEFRRSALASRAKPGAAAGTAGEAAKEGDGSDVGQRSLSGKGTLPTITIRGPASAIRQAGQGKPPEDIPPADNDDVLAQQIRSAAEMETDPEKRGRLWDEYRKYKGLPTKE